MHALVTGSAGFIGSTLAQHLLDMGWSTVHGIDSLTDYYDVSLKRSNLASIQDQRFTFEQRDVTTLTAQDVGRFTHIFHLAGQPGVRSSWGREFEAYTRDNIQATQVLLEAARMSDKLERFVYSSSSSVYGDAEVYPTTEEMVPRPRSPYGVTKLAGEHLTNVYAANHELPAVSLRYFTVYGPRQRPDMAFTRFMTAVKNGDDIQIYGDGYQERDFTHVSDVVGANLLSATTRVIPGSVFNVAGGSSATVREAIALIEAISGLKAHVSYREPVLGDVLRTGGETESIRSVLGWSSMVSLEAGLRTQWEWISSLATR